ncbi:unnamed protein product, partial [Ectocarpus sp. 4 AP-2014]
VRFEVKDGDFTQLGNRCQLFYRARMDPFRQRLVETIGHLLPLVQADSRKRIRAE